MGHHKIADQLELFFQVNQYSICTYLLESVDWSSEKAEKTSNRYIIITLIHQHIKYFVCCQIERETGATCGLAPAAEQKNEDEKVFEIKGSQLQIHHASHLVRIKVGEISPNTPVPPLQGAGGGYQQQQAMFSAGTQNGGYQSTGGFIQQQQQPQFQHQQQQWAPQNGGGVQQRLPTEMYQNPMQQPQASVIPQASADPAPAVNPATGAPDYSAQWAAYYRYCLKNSIWKNKLLNFRSIGLVEQAAMVESQMRRNQSNTAPLGDVSGVPQSQQPYYPQ